VSDRAGVHPIGHRLSPRTQDFDLAATRSPGLPFDGIHTRNLCNYMDYYSYTDPEGMEG